MPHHGRTETILKTNRNVSEAYKVSTNGADQSIRKGIFLYCFQKKKVSWHCCQGAHCKQTKVHHSGYVTGRSGCLSTSQINVPCNQKRTANRSNKEDLPTALSPINKILNKYSLLGHTERCTINPKTQPIQSNRVSKGKEKDGPLQFKRRLVVLAWDCGPIRRFERGNPKRGGERTENGDNF